MAWDKAKRNATQQKYHKKSQKRYNLYFHTTKDEALIDIVEKNIKRGITPTALIKKLIDIELQENLQMQNYKEHNKISLGSSDIARITVRYMAEGEKDVSYYTLHFGSDDEYSAYYIDGDCEIPSHYEKVFDKNVWWATFVDDTEVTQKLQGNDGYFTLRIFRAGDFGCIVQKIA